MGKESKSAVTIRRRRKRSSNSDSGRTDSKSRTSSHHVSWDIWEEDAEPTWKAPDIRPALVSRLLSSQKTLLLGLLAFRMLNCLMIHTSFVPDEYWQSLEVAHRMAFGYGYQTWEWRYGLRSYVYPAFIATIYRLLALLHLDTRILLIKLPQLMSAAFWALGDLYLYKMSRRLAGGRVALWTLLCTLCSWFAFYAGPRTLSNSIETVLTSIGLYYYPWPNTARKAHWKYISIVGLAVALRPTAAIVWSPLCLYHFYTYRQKAGSLCILFSVIGFFTFSLTSIVDRLFYGSWVNVHYNFLEFNVLHNMGSFYGAHPWYWYLVQGFEAIMGPHIFPFIMGAIHGMSRPLLAVITWTLAVYSMLTHKEFRFIFPILPMAMHVCGMYLNYATDAETDVEEEDDVNQDADVEDVKPSWSGDLDSSADLRPNGDSRTGGDTGTEGDIEDEESNDERVQQARHDVAAADRARMRWRAIVVAWMMVAVNLPIALYTSLLHQRGTIDIMRHIADEVTQGLSHGHDINVMFLMPCHSTPYYSHLHQNVSLRFLTCEPNLGQANYQDEADVFYRDPLGWLHSEYQGNATDSRNGAAGMEGSGLSLKLPSHLVMFNELAVHISEFLKRHKYRECTRLFHTHVPEGRVSSYVLMWCLHPPILSHRSTAPRKRR